MEKNFDFRTASTNELVNTEDQDGKVAGFWRGVWHGFIMPFMFLVSLFKEDVGLYEAHNNGKWYNFGYLVGLMMVLGGNGGVSKTAASQKKNS